jgi:hypothetical protein
MEAVGNLITILLAPVLKPDEARCDVDHHPHGVTRRQIVVSIILAVLWIISDSTRAAGPIPTGTLSGNVVDPDGKPVAGARVWTDTFYPKTSATKRLMEARTDAKGHFRLGPVEPIYRHRFDLVVDADGFARRSIFGGALSVYPGRVYDLGTISLDRGRVFTGRVRDVDGKPCANATVKPAVLRFNHGHTFRETNPDQIVITDADGCFRTPPLPVGRLALTIRAPERQLAHVAQRPIRPGGEEDLGTILLEPDVPVSGVVRDEDGTPIAGVKIGGTTGYEATTNAEGRFTLRGFGPNPSFQLNVSKNGYATLTGMVAINDAGVWYRTRRDNAKDMKPAKELVATMRRAGWIEGQAVDADTGEPVRLDRVVVCDFERKPSGEVVLRGCRSEFEQSEPGRFRASFPVPDEYHLTFSAAGYHDAEAYSPKVTELKTIGGLVAKLKKKTDGSTPTIVRQTISGIVTRHGRPVESGWVGLWALRRPSNAINAPVMRGRTVVGDPITGASAPIRNGSFMLEVPFQSETWYVVAEEPGQPLTQVGPIPIALKEQKTLNITCTEGGRIRGRVKGVPSGWEGHVWVIAFSKTAVRTEARADHDGTFILPALPPSEYGLKVGHDAYQDPEVYPGTLFRSHPEASKETADPWKRAKVVKVEAGRELIDVEVEWPQ